MGKSTKKKNKKVTAPKANIQELSISRDGGQIALRGYSYQFLYSCYLILSLSNPSNFFQLEGIEDIDCIMQKNGSNDITHIQLKYSVNKQDASFLTDVLKNFLEAYLLDQNRFFKLVYDFPVARKTILLGIGLFMISINLFHICHLRRLKNLYLLLKLKKP